MSLKDLNPTERFSDRVSDYVKYRPSYPGELLDFLDGRFHLKNLAVADVGAGTGIFTRLLVERGARVSVVEPNAAMRASAEKSLGAKANFFSGSAESTGLPRHSQALITVAQAFHWFDPLSTREEFRRVLTPEGQAAIIWNDSEKETPFGKAYDEIKIEFGGEGYRKVLDVEGGLDDGLRLFFGGKFEAHDFTFAQELDREGLIGRYFSSSYSPKADSPDRPRAEKAILEVFDKHQSQGRVRMAYKTELFLGPLHAI